MFRITRHETASLDPSRIRIVPFDGFPSCEANSSCLMADSAPGSTQEDPASRLASRARRPHGAVCRLGHARRVFGHHRRAHGGAHRGGTVRRLAHGRGRDCRQGRARGRAAHHLERRVEAAGGPDSILRPDHAGRHVRGRPARLSLRAVSLPVGDQRGEHRQGLRVDHGTRQGGGARTLPRSIRAIAMR